MKKVYIWIYGENYTKTANNNSYYMWKHIVKKEDDIAKYFVAEKNEKNKKVYNRLSKDEKKYFIWKNSKEHFQVYLKADLFVVTLSYKDVMPDKFLVKKIRLPIDRPVIYLQHGTLAMKKIDYTGTSYNNNMYKFLYYNEDIKERLIYDNKFNEYQLYYAKYHPRYKELVRINNITQEKKQIIWFLTWREFFGENDETIKLINHLKEVITDNRLNDYLINNHVCMKICFHSFFSDKQIKKIKEKINVDNIELVSVESINIMEELAKSSLLLTDYSSIGFDFTLLNKPVILYQPDLKEYTKIRKLYCDLNELEKNSVSNANELITTIMEENWHVNEFFRKRLPKEIDYKLLEEGKHIESLYKQFVSWQKNKVTIVGYDFDINDDINKQVKYMANELLKNGCMVELQALISKINIIDCPDGVNYKAFRNLKYTSKIESVRRICFNTISNSLLLRYDKYKIEPYVGHLLKKWAKKNNSKVIISTRSSISLFLWKKKIIFTEKTLCIDTNLEDINEEKKKLYIKKMKKYANNKKITKLDNVEESLYALMDGMESLG